MALVEACSGALGAVTATTLLYPLDIVKTVIQSEVVPGEGEQADRESDHPRLQDDPNGTLEKKSSKPSSFSTFRRIVKEDGVTGLYQGLWAKNTQAVLQKFVYFYWYTYLKRRYERTNKTSMTASVNLMIGSLAGALNMSITTPIETAATVLQVSHGQDRPTSLIECGRQIFKAQGWSGLYSGFGASLILTANPAIEYTVFEQLRKRIIDRIVDKRNIDVSKRYKLALTAWQAFYIAAVAKMIATVCTYPYIRAKVVLQSHPSQTKLSALDIIKQILKDEGALGLYRGLPPQITKTLLASAILMTLKERIARTARVILRPLLVK